MRLFRNLAKLCLELLFPSNCYRCDLNPGYLCEPCGLSLPIKLEQCCVACGKASLGGFTHPKCQTKYLPERLVTLFDYRTFPIRQLVTQGKYHFIPGIFKRLGELLAMQISLPEGSCVVPVPLHQLKRNWRGFNQAELLAQTVAHRLELTVASNLTRPRFTKPQTGLNKALRQSNLTEVFDFQPIVPEPSLVILIDDVCTTGSTFRSATKSIKKHSINTRVWCLAIAQD